MRYFLSIVIYSAVIVGSAWPPSSSCAQGLQTPSRKAKCGVPHAKLTSNNRCLCQSGYLYNKASKKCIKANKWCKKRWAKRSFYRIKKRQCACPAGKALQEGAVYACVKDMVFEGVVTIDDSDLSGGSGQFDFETRIKSLASSDIAMGGMIINGTWTGAVDWQVVIMSQEFDAVKECPASGYAGVDDPDGDGMGNPRAAYAGGVYCLMTSSGNFAKILVQNAYYDSEREWRVLTFKYAFRLGGNAVFP